MIKAELLFTDQNSKLYKKAQKLIKAGYEFWEEHQKSGSCAVVWLTDDSGKTIIFSRGEYVEAIKQAIRD